MLRTRVRFPPSPPTYQDASCNGVPKTKAIRVCDRVASWFSAVGPAALTCEELAQAQITTPIILLTSLTRRLRSPAFWDGECKVGAASAEMRSVLLWRITGPTHGGGHSRRAGKELDFQVEREKPVFLRREFYGVSVSFTPPARTAKGKFRPPMDFVKGSLRHHWRRLLNSSIPDNLSPLQTI